MLWSDEMNQATLGRKLTALVKLLEPLRDP